jgi:hypothetical protein
MIKCFVRSESGILWKFTRFRVVMRKRGGREEPVMVKKEGENLRNTHYI